MTEARADGPPSEADGRAPGGPVAASARFGPMIGDHFPTEPKLNPRSLFRSPVHDEKLAATLGVALGVTFSVCFITGMTSHLIQDPPSWFVWPSRPVWGYRFTQGLHVATGLASIPLLLAKLWVVVPKLFEWPPVKHLAHLLERIALLALVGGSLFLLFSGVGNIARWRPWMFSFTAGHFWAAQITMGALLIHIGHKVATARRVLLHSENHPPLEELAVPGTVPPTRAPVLTRRGFLASVGLASGVITLTTAGQTVGWLHWFNRLGVRQPDAGPQGVPINKTASGAGVTEKITDARLTDYRLEITGRVPQPITLSLEDLRAMRQYTARLPIACVEGWSSSGHWAGVRVRDLLDRAGADEHAEVRVESMQKSSLYSSSRLNRMQARDPLTLLALELNGETLHPDHGRPVRLIGPNRPGVQQTKWVERLVVL